MNREDVAMDVTVQNVEILRKEVQAAKLLLSECAEIFSEEGICNIELRGYLSGKLSAGEVIELLDPPAEQRNQCDGCQAGIPLVDGAHRMGRPGSYPDLMSCQKERYEHPEQAEGAQGERETARKALSPENQRVVPVQPLLAEPHPLAALAQPSPAPAANAVGSLPPFAEKVVSKLRRFYDCAEDFESGGVDIGRHWLDLLTRLGLLNRVQRSPALWEISQQGEDLLAAPVAQAGRVPEGYMVLQTASLSHVLGLVEGAMEDAYGNAFQVCCGKGSGGECCGDPEAGWSPEDQRTMDVLNPIQRELRAMLAAAPAQGGRDE